MKKKVVECSLVCLLGAGTAAGLATGVAAGQKEVSKAPFFEEVPVPVTDLEKRKINVSKRVTVDGRAWSIGYKTILRSGDQVGEGIFGLLLDRDGSPVRNKDGSPHISVDNDFSSLLPAGDKLFMVSHFESRSGAMYLTELEQDRENGSLRAVTTKNIDFSEYGGLWVPCAGSVTPWGTHLGSEEYPTDARVVAAAASMDEIEEYDKPMARYFGLDPYGESTTVEKFRQVFKPYRYGYPVEVAVSADGNAHVQKHFSMGRVAVELPYVMPDKKTVYISDDGTNVGFFMFVADRPGDLSSGTLYGARWNQVHSVHGGYADLEWINLGHADDENVRRSIEGGITFTDLFITAKPSDKGDCEAGFASVNTTTGLECLRVRPGMERIASRLETRRYAALKGATTEFRKEEGITFDPEHSRLYVAMSQVAKGMGDGTKYDKGGPNHVRLPENRCGVVYGLNIGSDAAIGSDYVAKNMYGVVAGTMRTYPEKSEFANNTCDVNTIANPDNITYMVGRDTLIIGEDSGSGHQNDAIWAFNSKSGNLTRIQTTPYGSETTSPYFYPNINGFGYLMSVVQHPYGESDEDKLSDPADARAYTGYIGPLPAMD